MEIYCQILSRIFGKNFVKITFLLKKLARVDLTNFFLVTVHKFFIFAHCDYVVLKHFVKANHFFDDAVCKLISRNIVHYTALFHSVLTKNLLTMVEFEHKTKRQRSIMFGKAEK